MKIYLMTAGTRGDVEPFVALGVALRAAGHDAWLAAGASLGGLARDRGLPFHEIRTDLFEMVDDPEAAKALRSPIAAIRLIPSLRPKVRAILDDLEAGADGADLIVAAPKAIAGVHLAERMAIPVLLAAATPMLVPTSAFPLPGFPVPPLRMFNRLSYRAQRAAVRPFRKEIAAWRHDLGLDDDWDPLTLRGTSPHVLYAFSPAMVPPPEDWAGKATVTGAWTLAAADSWTPPPELERFIHAAREVGPVISIGFGSMPLRDPSAVLALIGEVIDAVGCRAVIVGGKSGFASGEVPESCLFIDAVPHSWLFNQVSAVVHHGGAGTTHAGLAAGRPTLVVPVFGDQPFWGRRVQEVGVGPEPLSIGKLNERRLTRSLERLVNDDTYADRAREIRTSIATEVGVNAAIEVIEAQHR